jgi:hypothetical protein
VVGSQVFTAYLHRCGAKAVSREHTGDRSPFVHEHHTQVLSVGFANTGFGHANAQTWNGMEGRRQRGDEVYRHGFNFPSIK